MITYTITVTNTTAVEATNVVVTDTLNGVDTVLSGATSIGAGQAETYLFSYMITEDDCDTDLSNVASVSADGIDPVETAAPVVTAVVCNDPETFYVYMPYVASAP
jgi:uncharacterized repeat protein (TIGR01451 family)